MNFIASLEPHVIMYILSSISEGLTALGNSTGFSRDLGDLGWDWEKISVLWVELDELRVASLGLKIRFLLLEFVLSWDFGEREKLEL